MTLNKVEKTLLQKMEQAHVPPLPFRWEFYCDESVNTTEWEAVTLYPVKRYQTGAAAAGAAAVGIIGTLTCLACLKNGGLPGISRPTGESAPLSLNVSAAGVTSGEQNGGEGAPMTAEDKAILRRLAAAVPGLKAENLIANHKQLHLKGRFTDKDTEESLYLCQFINLDEMYYYLFVESKNGMLVKKFAAFSPSSVDRMLIRDLTGDGLDELLVTIPNGGSSRGPNMYILSFTNETPKLIFHTNQLELESELGSALPPFDFGSFFEPLPGYRMLMKNKFIPATQEIDLSSMADDESFLSAFDEEGRPQNALSEIDWVTDFALVDVDNDGEDELEIRGDVWFHFHVHTIGQATAYLKYRPDTGAYEVIKTTYTPLS